MTDRTYWHVPGLRSWHALNGVVFTARDRFDGGRVRIFSALCGHSATDTFTRVVQRADRIPPTAHLCGSCSRVIAARTDIEDMGDLGNVAAS